MELKVIPLGEIQPNPFQPRESFEKESLKDLADSIKDAGVIQPIVVRRRGFNYQIIAGERRWRAAQIAGLKEIVCIVKEIDDERVLLESLIENLHRRNLTDVERENAVYELWENREEFGFESKSELARAIGVPLQNVDNDLEAWEFRHNEEGISSSIPTYIISRSRGLPVEERKKIVEKVQKGQLKAQEAYTTIKVLRKAPESIKKELLKSKSPITPKMAETIVTKLPAEEEQEQIIEEIKRSKLTEDEVEDRIREIQRTKKEDKSMSTNGEAEKGTVHIVGEYDCPHCRRHYIIKCDGKHDWLE